MRVDGQRYSARSRYGTSNQLARLLVAAGVADQPVEIRQVGIKGCISYRSLHELWLWAYQETASAPLRRVCWMPPPDFTAAARIRSA